MKRNVLDARPNWKQLTLEYGYDFYETAHIGVDCWKEDCHYEFTLGQVDYIEAVTEILHKMCMDLVMEVAASPRLMNRLMIPEFMHDYIKESVKGSKTHLYGRFDLAHNGIDQPKLLEYNADTPTALFETAVWQWRWLEDLIASHDLPANADQFNSVHDKLIARWKAILPPGETVHFTCMQEYEEDRGTVRYLQDTAEQAGFKTKTIDLAQIGVSGGLWDLENERIDNLFKLYPWEWLVLDGFKDVLPKLETKWIEPAWKMILSNKGMLALLWERYPNHPNLLPAYFEHDFEALHAFPDGFVKKPLLSREGANITVVRDKEVVSHVAGVYGAEGYIKQGIANIPTFESEDGGLKYAVLGSWVVGNEPAGMIVRESSEMITNNWSQLVPHFIRG
jgi:glutathionylspermidine synthase